MGAYHLQNYFRPMKTFVWIIGLLAIFAAWWVIANRAEKLRIVYSIYVTNSDAKLTPAVCYSNEQWRNIKDKSLSLSNQLVIPFDLDANDTFACIIPDHKITEIIGRQDIGFIKVEKSQTNGVFIAVVK